MVKKKKPAGKPPTPAQSSAPAREASTPWSSVPGFDDEAMDLPLHALNGLTDLMTRHAAGMTRAGVHFKSLGHDGLFELRYEHSNNHFRVIFIRHNNRYVALTTFPKNQERTPRRNLTCAKTRATSWRNAHPKL